MKLRTILRLRTTIVSVALLPLFACAKSQVRIEPERSSPIEPSMKTSLLPSLTAPSTINSSRIPSHAKTYSETVSQWKSSQELVQWMEKEFSFDAERFKKFERTLPPPRSPEETFQLKSGIYIDATLFVKETLHRIDPSYRPKIVVLIVRHPGMNHYFCSFRKGGQLFIMDYGTPFKETTGIHGPYHSLEAIKKFVTL